MAGIMPSLMWSWEKRPISEKRICEHQKFPLGVSAGELYELIKGFGTDLDRMSYSAESAQMKKLIEELEKTEQKAKLAALSLTTAFTELKTKQENFEQIYAEQVEANADLRKTPSATAIRRDLEKSLRTN